MAMQDMSEDIAREKARIQDMVVERLLDKHGLKGLTKEELELRGYWLAHGIDPWQQTVTWKLFKFVDSTSYKFKVNLEFDQEDRAVSDMAYTSTCPDCGATVDLRNKIGNNPHSPTCSQTPYRMSMDYGHSDETVLVANSKRQQSYMKMMYPGYRVLLSQKLPETLPNNNGLGGDKSPDVHPYKPKEDK